MNEAQRKQYAKEFATKGGNALKAKYGMEHYKKLGQLAVEARKKKAKEKISTPNID